MPGIQVVIDSDDPHALARFWAVALEMEVEDHHDLVDEMVASGRASSDDTVEIDGRLAWKEATAIRDASGKLPRVLFQTVPESTTVKNRVHLDIHVGEDQREAKVNELLAAGATRLWDGEQGPFTWVTLADPEGNEFCVA